MKLRHLDIFYAVMTCGSLTRAAEVLHISQPAASKHSNMLSTERSPHNFPQNVTMCDLTQQ